MGYNVADVMHNEHMTTQVVLSPHGRATELCIAAVPGTGAIPDNRTLHLGTQDLLRVAAFAAGSGFDLVRFYWNDPYLQPLDPVSEDELSREMLDLFERFGEQEALSALDDDFDGLLVVGVEMRSHATGATILLRRRGFIDTAQRDEARDLLTKAWRKLRLT
ncbi:hypothetical protein [Microbacterium sp.]|uniref:hypothetical protein n=1 Tax=Microbacterium sp. TaxID=51671 RepID=UPI003A94B0B5